MKVVSLRKMKAGLFAACLVALLVLMGGVYVLRGTEQPGAKADRSNAMQVVKTLPAEQPAAALASDFFTEYRLERDRIRSERSDLLREILQNSKTDESRQKAQDAVLKMVLEKQRESEMENLIKARGFADALVLMRDNSVSAIVKTQSLTREDVLQVAEVISRVSGFRQEDITISAKP
ncbi:MAG TPA: SpoIIIAH-like family protein [Selenomonadales bacterium]|nr:SpoIIIAH-like family protein [Selenomonadales bacterium]